MNTDDHSTDAAPAAAPIGVVGLPDFANVCAQIGLRPVHDPDPAAALAHIQEALDVHGAFPVVISDTVLADLWHWVDSFAARTNVVILGEVPGLDPHSTPDTLHVLGLPSSVATVLETAGFTGVHAALHEVAVHEDGHAQLPATPQHAAPAETHPEPDAQVTDGAREPRRAAHAATAPGTGADIADPTPAVTAEPSAPAAAAPESAPAEEAVVSDGGDNAQQGACLVVWAAKGGVGKSTLSIALAQRAAQAGLSVCLVDANVGQGDLRTYLKVGTSGFPSIYQAALSENPADAVVDRDLLNDSRPIKLERLEFAIVQAPPPHIADADLVTPQLYDAVVRYARSVFDLVIVDTQIIEAKDRSGGMVDQFLTPLLRSPNTWGLGLTDNSSGVTNLLNAIKKFAQSGVRPDRQLTALNRMPGSATNEVPGIRGAFEEHSTFLDAVFNDDSVAEHTNRGRPVSHLPAYAALLDGALGRVHPDGGRFATPAAAPTLPAPSSPEAPAEETTAPLGKNPQPAAKQKKNNDSFFLSLLRRGK